MCVCAYIYKYIFTGISSDFLVEIIRLDSSEREGSNKAKALKSFKQGRNDRLNGRSPKQPAKKKKKKHPKERERESTYSGGPLGDEVTRSHHH